MARKTIAVDDLKSRVNTILLMSDSDRQASRTAVSVLLEGVLFDTDNYKGFRHLPSEFDDNGYLREGYDDTRRKYF